MGQPAAKQGDKITAVDTHIVISAGSSAPASLPFSGTINGDLSNNVQIMGKFAATVGSGAENSPPHMIPPPATFQTPPKNRGAIQAGSATVLINGKLAARNGDIAVTCNDPVDLPVGQVVATGTVLIGG